MNLIARVRPDNPQANLIWRFFSDSTHHWKWQRLAFDGSVVEHSKSAYSQYEACLADAREHGYVSLPSLSTKANSTSPKVKRSSIRLNTNHQKVVAAIVTEALEQDEDIPIDDAADGLATKEKL
jgi:hypothetical protein